MKPFESHLLHGFGITPADVEPTETPGYWRRKIPCKGAPECREPLHSTLFNSGPVHHTISFYDDARDAQGRWSSPFATWHAARKAAGQ